ncbi:HEPN domain-containing protein [Pleomorphomonas carboxyditropha]|uniref:Nucleotidyltransferase n=1 Tax=Pleomorphomonas carboxyditropha TaxID=2023338 RepID=A0A2G9WNY5_9HYPH|nr:HEPN domain-containing protein [Pleomorphomonas carboxyditropha]PIO96365.1 nucleotidyltransferase [Pleomorphomonas carboxyditropha]
MHPDGLDHLPDAKRRELDRIAQILFEEFDEALKTKLSDRNRNGRILKLILFGSHARGDWVDDRKSGYRSDYDLLVVVNTERFTDQTDFWDGAGERLMRELAVSGWLATPVNFIVHSLEDVCSQLRLGRPFFVDIARDGIPLYEAEGYPLPAPMPLSEEDRQAEARQHFDHFFPGADALMAAAGFLIQRGDFNLAAFQLHQATERLYHCVLLVLTLYSPKSHRLERLRSQAEDLDARLVDAWPRDTKQARRCFARLKRAYIDARYSPRYEITPDELEWIAERVGQLASIVETVCREKIGDR